MVRRRNVCIFEFASHPSKNKDLSSSSSWDSSSC